MATMLVLTRKLGEGITIGQDVRVVVIEIRDGQVRLGVEAPRSVQVHRDEVWARIIQENRQAAEVGSIPVERLRAFGMGRGKA